MPQAPGTRLGPYEIVAALGAGGMGEVYRARDTRLGRNVAIKVLGDGFHDHPEYRARFEREARAVAELSHPNIAALYDIGRDGDVDFLVLELVEGETLANRLRKGPLAIGDVCLLGAQIADALAAAHGRGIVHRDLKPSNVVVTAGGAKLLDFGLARRFEQTAGDTAAATVTRDLTATGTILGTMPYMAPEQVEGRTIDARTDVFALGSVLWEMATGVRAFDAPNDVALIGAILATEPPPLSAVRQDTPPALDRLVRECLRKDPERRWQSARDAALVLHGIAGDAATGSAPGQPRRRLTPALLATGLVALALVPWAWQALAGPSPAPEAESVRFTIEPPAGGAFAYHAETNYLAVSPDGRRIAYVASDGAGSRIWVRDLGSVDAIPLRGTEGATGLTWSPDGRSLAFSVDGRLQRVDPPDGTPVTISETGRRVGEYLSWGLGGSILFAGSQGEAIFRVPAGGGAPERMVSADSGHGNYRVQFPQWLPDGRRFLYVARGADDSGPLMLVSEPGVEDTVMFAESFVQYSEAGVLTFVRDGRLLAQAFDPRTGRVSGDPVGVADGVRYFLSTGAAGYATAGGTLVYQTGNNVERLAWFDRTGLETGGLGGRGSFLGLSISPDGSQVLIDREDPQIRTWDIVLLDAERGVESTLTMSRTTEVHGTWIPGRDSVLYSVSSGRPPTLTLRSLSSGIETQLLSRDAYHQPTDVSSDGRIVLFSRRPAGGSFDIWSLDLDGRTAPRQLVAGPGNEESARFSPDGRHVAFLSDETGTPELYVTAFPEPGPRLRVSPDGARMVRWSRATGELIWVTPGGRVLVTRIRANPFRIDRPDTLFTLPTGTMWTAFDITPDGQRFLAVVAVSFANTNPLTVITNWKPRF